MCIWIFLSWSVSAVSVFSLRKSMLFSLYQILLNLSQRYKNSSRAAVSPGEPGELVCVCWGGGLCSCVCPLWVYSLCVCL